MTDVGVEVKKVQAAPLAPPYTPEIARSLPKFDRGVSWLCWAYNEEMLIGDYILRAHALLREVAQDYEILILDDGSTDRTPEIVRALQTEIPELRLVRNERNLNIGLSARRAIASATKEYLFWQTADWSYDISYLRIFLELLKSYDVVMGVRSRQIDLRTQPGLQPFAKFLTRLGVYQITKRSDTVGKAVISLINYWLIRFLFHVPLTDYQNVVFHTTRMAQSVDFEVDSSFTTVEALVKLYWRGAQFCEVPIDFIPRQKGEAKGTKVSSLGRSVRDILGAWWRWVVLGDRGLITKGTVRRLRLEEWER